MDARRTRLLSKAAKGKDGGQELFLGVDVGTSSARAGSEPNFGSRMEVLLSKHESGPEVLATVCLGLDDKQVVAIKGSKDCLLSDSIVELKEKCMQILGAHLLRHQVPLEEPDLDILDEYVGDEGEEGKDTAGKQSKT